VSRRVIWDRPENPPQRVADQLQMDRRVFGKRLHKIKGVNKLSGTDRVIICDDGSVWDEQGEPLGNLNDED